MSGFSTEVAAVILKDKFDDKFCRFMVRAPRVLKAQFVDEMQFVDEVPFDHETPFIGFDSFKFSKCG